MVDPAIYPALTCGIFISLGIFALLRQNWLITLSALLSILGYLLTALQKNPKLALTSTLAGFSISLTALITFASISANGRLSLPIKLLIIPIIFVGPIIGTWLMYHKNDKYYDNLKETSSWILLFLMIMGLLLYILSSQMNKYVIVAFILAIIALIMRIIPIYHPKLNINAAYIYIGEFVPELCLLIYLILFT